MAPCEHLSMLRIEDKQGIRLYDDKRMERVMQGMTNPRDQYPSFQFYIGRKSKFFALRELFPHNNIHRGRQDRSGIASLRLDATSLSSDRPIFFAESDLTAQTYSHREIFHCHQSYEYKCCWTATNNQNLYDVLHARLFFLFTDVICIFADDFKNINDVTNRLRVWAACGSASNFCREVRPRVIIIGSSTANLALDLYGTRDISSSFDDHLQNAFSGISVLRVAEDSLSPLARHSQLKDVIWRQTDQMRQVRKDYHLLFSGAHMSELFSRAIQHTANSISQPYCFISASREGSELLNGYNEKLATFFQLGGQMNLDRDMLASYTASSMLMDFYPPEMHSMFTLWSELNV